MENIPQDKRYLIVYSSDKNASYFITGFSIFKHLLLHNESGASGFVARLNEFTEGEFNDLNERIRQLDEKDVGMTETEMIITVVALHYISTAFVNEEEESLLIEAFGEEYEEYIKIRNKFLDFTTYVFEYVNDNVPFNLTRFWNVMKYLES